MLQHVRERLLGDAVEGCLCVRRKASVRKLRLDVDRDLALLLDDVPEPLDRRYEAEVVESSGPQLDGEAPDVLQSRDDELAELRHCCSVVVAVGFIFQRLQPEEDRGQGLAGLVVQFSCESRTLELLRLDDAANRVTADALGERDRCRRPCRERLG